MRSLLGWKSNKIDLRKNLPTKMMISDRSIVLVCLFHHTVHKLYTSYPMARSLLVTMPYKYFYLFFIISLNEWRIVLLDKFSTPFEQKDVFFMIFHWPVLKFLFIKSNCGIVFQMSEFCLQLFVFYLNWKNVDNLLNSGHASSV